MFNITFYYFNITYSNFSVASNNFVFITHPLASDNTAGHYLHNVQCVDC